MALKSPYLAAENSATARRQRALHRFLALSPLALLVAVGLVAHLPKPPYPHPAGSADYDRKVLAYSGVVAASQALETRSETTPLSDLVRVAKQWTDGYGSGRLVPVPSAVYEDHFRDGVRGEIVRTGIDLGGALLQRGDRAFEQGKPPLGAENEILGAEVVMGLRDFDIQAHLQCLLLARRATGVLLRVWPTLPANVKDGLRPRLRKMLVDPSEVEALEKTDAAQLHDYLVRQKIDLSDVRSNGLVSEEEKGAALRGVAASNERVNALLKG